MDHPVDGMWRQGTQGPLRCAGTLWPCTVDHAIPLGSHLCLLEEAVWLNISTATHGKVGEVCSVRLEGQSKGCR